MTDHIDESIMERLKREWDLEKNGRELESIPRYSHRKWWWKCSVNPDHQWSTRLSVRMNGSGCPICLGRGNPAIQPSRETIRLFGSKSA